MDEARLIRFVAGPDGAVTPDLARKLPGRGLWVAARREAVETAARKGLFARAAKAPLTATADLADQVERLLRARLLAGLGLARKAGDLTFGFEKVLAAISAGKAAWLIEAADGAGDGRRKLLAAARRRNYTAPAPGRVQFGRIGFGLGRAECDTHRLPCGAGRRALDNRMSSGWRASVRSSLRVGARSPRSGRAQASARPRRGVF